MGSAASIGSAGGSASCACAAAGVRAAGAAGPRPASGLMETAPPKQLGSRPLALRLLPASAAVGAAQACPHSWI
jgi:hypothetical protein